jgi:hypothetical protein
MQITLSCLVSTLVILYRAITRIHFLDPYPVTRRLLQVLQCFKNGSGLCLMNWMRKQLPRQSELCCLLYMISLHAVGLALSLHLCPRRFRKLYSLLYSNLSHTVSFTY